MAIRRQTAGKKNGSPNGLPHSFIRVKPQRQIAGRGYNLTSVQLERVSHLNRKQAFAL
ncbi:hypothetical protein PSEUDO8AS_90025 [Pseudomonas sp. 8AS]|nr:hypothetical protein PSEUDO8AS_90025 [Pseudomonas sp. 8AS]